MIADLFRVVRAGQELANAETWKKRQALANALVALLVPLAAIGAQAGYLPPLGQSDLELVAGGVAALVLGLFNLWATYATTRRIGLPPRPADLPDGTDDGIRDGSPAGDPAVRRPDPDAGDPVSILNMEQRG